MPGRLLQHLPGARVTRLDPARTGLSLSALLLVETLHEAVQFLDEQGYFLEDITGLHVAEGFELDYYFAHFERPERICLRLVAPQTQPEVATISDIFPGADWHERETADFIGVRFVGHPNPQPLLLPEDSLEHPLLRTGAELKSIHALLPQECFINALPESLDLPGRRPSARAESAAVEKLP